MFDLLAQVKEGVVDLVGEDALRQRLSTVGPPLRVKAGFDPTRPDLHLGHAVLLAKLRQFQKLGHTVVLVVGNFTATIGDPSGRNKTRPALTEAEVDAATDTYAEQVFTLLDRHKTDMVFNRNWLGRMTFADVIRLASKSTLASVMARNDFHERFTTNQSIGLHELLYPLAQAQDSVHLQPDIEIGGTDQLFNLMLGRKLMEDAGQRPQVVMTVPLLEGLSGDEKMSKSLGNYVAFNESAFEQIAKLMSISDDRLWRYVQVLSGLLGPRDMDVIRGHEAVPRQAKMLFATAIARIFHGSVVADAAAANWTKQFTEREQPDDVAEVRVRFEDGERSRVVAALVAAGMTSSRSEARRKIDEGAVKLDGATVEKDVPDLLAVGPHVVKLGRRWARVIVEG